nr:response regulator [uncultured Methanoregula sp.]
MVHVLYVDDEECLLDICQMFLRQMGNISVDIAQSVDAGLDLVTQNDYDVIISDYEMPVKNGIDFLKILRSRGNRTPFIVFTGRGREEIVIEAFNSGADFYLQKGGEMKSQFAELIHKVTIAVERRKGERELENSNSLLKATLESTADGIVVVDSGGAVSVFNQKFLQMWNLAEGSEGTKTEQAFLGHIRDQVSDFPAFEKPLLAVRNNPDSGSYDIIHCRDGRIFRRFSQAQKIGNRIVGRVWSYRDITGQSRAELELRAAYEQIAAAEGELNGHNPEPAKNAGLILGCEENYSTVFHAADCPLLLIDPQSLGILELNPAAAGLYGYGKDEMLSLSLCQLSSEDGPEPRTTCKASHDIRMQLQRKKNGSVFPAEISTSPLCLGSRQILVIVVRDLSRTKQREDALALSNRKLNLLFGITRHDILNKLSALSGYNELLQTRNVDPPVRGMLEKQQKTIDDIWKQIEFTKEYDKLGAGSPQWYRLDEISGRAYSQILQPVQFQCDTRNVEIYADPMMEKVFYNLFDNALRYGEGISRIRLSWALAGEELLILFEDNGIGIARDEKERIFERGYGKNTGLGLFLTREILSLTGMTIRETGEFQKGARFEIRVPFGNYRLLTSAAESQDYGNRLPVLIAEE